MNKKKCDINHFGISSISIYFPLFFNCIPIKQKVILSNNIITN
jgi:hypothetical protein